MLDVWDAGRYDPKISSSDSVDENGWLGSFDPETGDWIPGLYHRSPLGWNANDTKHHYWGPYPFTVTAREAQSWVEIPARSGLQGQVDLGKDPFYIGARFWITSGWGFGAEYAWTTPYTFLKFYSECCGPDDIHNGWFIRSYFIWFEAIVRYYENTPPKYKNLKIQNDTYAAGPFSITVTITDTDAENETLAGVASAELVYDMNGVIDRRIMSGPPEGGTYTGMLPKVSVNDTVTYWIEARDPPGLSSHSDRVTFARIEPLHPHADILVIWDDRRFPDLDTFFVDLFSSMDTKYEFELWNIAKRQGIDATVLNWGWNTIYLSGWSCEHTLPGHDYTGNQFVEWLDAGTSDEPHSLLYIDQDYLCAQDVYGCSWDDELTDGDFLHDYFGNILPLSDNPGMRGGGYDSVAVGIGDFTGLRINFWPDALTENPVSWAWPDWLAELTPDAEQIFRYKDTEFGAGVRVDRGHYKTVYLPWQDYFAVDSLEHGDLVPRPGLTAAIEMILDWFGARIDIEQQETVTGIPGGHHLFQNYPNPFNVSTDIRYQIVDSRSLFPTILKIYNILGQEVKTLVNEEQEPGWYTFTWDGRDTMGIEMSSGVYYYLLKSGTFSHIRKMLLLK